MRSVKYLSPFFFLALVPLGACLGGAGTLLAAAGTPLILAALDARLGDDLAPGRSDAQSWRWLPRLYIVAQLAVSGWAAARIALGGVPVLDALGLTLSCGVTTGVFGFVAAHEMIHSRSERERALGLIFLASVFYMHFRIAHLHGHHRRAATFKDPASARLGESLYAFLLRSISGQFRDAWRFEERRSGRNRMIGYLAIEGLFLAIVAGLSWKALGFVLAVAVMAVILLEGFNYVAHYGLSRREGEPLGPQHSWNSKRRMNNASLLNMGRHSDHHRNMARSYERLEPVAQAAELPSGYASALLTAVVPPLWRRVMDPRARSVMERG